MPHWPHDRRPRENADHDGWHAGQSIDQEPDKSSEAIRSEFRQVYAGHYPSRKTYGRGNTDQDKGAHNRICDPAARLSNWFRSIDQKADTQFAYAGGRDV